VRRRYVTAFDVQKMPEQFLRGHADLAKEWPKATKALYLDGLPLDDLPKVVSYWAKHVFDLPWTKVLSLAGRGDFPFFRGLLLGLDVIDQEMLQRGMNASARAPVIYLRWLVDGLCDLAEQRFVKLGGNPALLDTAKKTA
jgi:hypothetical protein